MKWPCSFIKLLLTLHMIFILFSFSLSPKKSGASLNGWTMDIESAKSLAQREKKPIFINFTGSDWCYWCIHMDKKVFSKPDWIDYADKNLVNVFIDFPKDKSKIPAKYVTRNQILQREYGVRGYPTFIILDSSGQTVLGRLGADKQISPSRFIQKIEQTLRLSESYIYSHAKKLSLEKRELLLALYKKYRSLTLELENWIDNRPEKSKKNIEIYQSYTNNIHAKRIELLSYY